MVLDLHMPGGSVLEAIPKLRAESPAPQIVLLTMEVDVRSLRAARKAGAPGYVLKEAADSELADAVRRAAAGQPYLNRDLAGHLVPQRIVCDPSD